MLKKMFGHIFRFWKWFGLRTLQHHLLDVSMHASTYVSTYAYMYVSIYISMYVFMYAHILICVCIKLFNRFLFTTKCIQFRSHRIQLIIRDLMLSIFQSVINSESNSIVSSILTLKA